MPPRTWLITFPLKFAPIIVSILFSSILTYLAWTLIRLESNVHRARALDVPIVRIPFGVNSYTWVILQPFVWNLLNFLPVPLSSYLDCVRYSHRTCHFLENSRPTATLRPVWALVSPEEMSLHIADPDMIGEIFARWRDFVRPVQKYRKPSSIPWPPTSGLACLDVSLARGGHPRRHQRTSARWR